MAELLRSQGYAATGIQQLAEAAGAPTGSIYHHFKGGKRAVAAAALRHTGAAYIQLLPLLLDPHEDLATGVEAAFAQAAEDLENTGWANMCPVGTVTGEIADAEPELRAVADEVIASWIDEGSQYLVHRGLSPSDARAAVYALLGALEGAFILARGQRSTEPLLAAGHAIATYVAALPVTTPASPSDLGVGREAGLDQAPT
ncbi:transcriptional regulator, TetR family [Amycolatopsis marina]|uniref:Transcriptional regulator, TetR family n=2 Tax=Amycolatopsis marina TaxID=490629 RepID=A0A1I1B2A2_9PSEU|nr:transcriptional regulator, TetR family [Amycolatopsis marina]